VTQIRGLYADDADHADCDCGIFYYKGTQQYINIYLILGKFLYFIPCILYFVSTSNYTTF